MEPYGFQERVAAFVAAHELETAAETRLLDLVPGVGELAKEMLSPTRYGRESFRPSDE